MEHLERRYYEGTSMNSWVDPDDRGNDVAISLGFERLVMAIDVFQIVGRSIGSFFNKLF